MEVKFKQSRELFRQVRLPTAIRHGCAITADFSQAGPDYFVMTLHFIDEQWKLVSQILDFVPFPQLQSEFDENEEALVVAPKSAENVREFVNMVLKEHGWSIEEAKKVFMVTDEATNFSFGIFCVSKQI